MSSLKKLLSSTLQTKNSDLFGSQSTVVETVNSKPITSHSLNSIHMPPKPNKLQTIQPILKDSQTGQQQLDKSRESGKFQQNTIDAKPITPKQPFVSDISVLSGKKQTTQPRRLSKPDKKQKTNKVPYGFEDPQPTKGHSKHLQAKLSKNSRSNIPVTPSNSTKEFNTQEPAEGHLKMTPSLLSQRTQSSSASKRTCSRKARATARQAENAAQEALKYVSPLQMQSWHKARAWPQLARAVVDSVEAGARLHEIKEELELRLNQHIENDQRGREQEDATSIRSYSIGGASSDAESVHSNKKSDNFRTSCKNVALNPTRAKAIVGGFTSRAAAGVAQLYLDMKEAKCESLNKKRRRRSSRAQERRSTIAQRQMSHHLRLDAQDSVEDLPMSIRQGEVMPQHVKNAKVHDRQKRSRYFKAAWRLNPTPADSTRLSVVNVKESIKQKMAVPPRDVFVPATKIFAPNDYVIPSLKKRSKVRTHVGEMLRVFQLPWHGAYHDVHEDDIKHSVLLKDK